MVEAALQVVVQTESSEINQIFYAAVAATDSAFVKKLRPFQEVMGLGILVMALMLARAFGKFHGGNL